MSWYRLSSSIQFAIAFSWLISFNLLRPTDLPGAAQIEDKYQRQQIGDVVFQIPQGLSIERIAGSPLTERPIVATWDDAGRLLVLESAGVVNADKERNGSRPHRLVRLVDENQDGIYDQRIVAAEDLSFPVGVLSIGNSTLVSAPPHIWRLIDEDGDGVCERREVWFDGGTLTGCYNDLHGPYLGPDGWIYWCKGAFAEQSHAQFKGKQLTSSAAHIFRKRLEGGPSEAAMTGGMDNPVEVAFAREGERFFTSTFLQHPSGGLRDGIAHAVYGGVHGKDHEPIQGHLRTGPLMPIMTHLGPAAPSGLLTLRSNSLIHESRLLAEDRLSSNDQFLVAALFNLQKVTLHRLVPAGATYRTEDYDLLLADRIDFHPTDVLEDADGSLIVIDTGGWYNLCCPSSALDQAAALGGIYRISSPASKGVVNPRGQGLDWSQFNVATAIQRLSSESWWVGRRAQRWIEANSAAAEHGLARYLEEPTHSTESRLETLWCLCRLGTAEAQRSIVIALNDHDSSIRHAASLAIAVQRWQAVEPLTRLLASDPNSSVRRAAAEALGRTGGRETIGPLMQAISDESVIGDAILQHSILFALMELDQPELVAKYLASSDPLQERAALLVLAQMKSDLLTPTYVFSAASSSDSSLRERAVEVLRNRPQWSGELSEQLAKLWETARSIQSDRQAVMSIIGGWYRQPEIIQLLGQKMLLAPRATVIEQTLLVDALEVSRPSDVPTDWSEPLANWLVSESLPQSLRMRLVYWLGDLSLDPSQDEYLIRRLADFADASSDDLATAIVYSKAMPDQTNLLSPKLTNQMIEALWDPNQLSNRSTAARVLARMKLSSEQARHLCSRLDSVDPMDFLAVISAIAKAGDDAIDQRMLSRLSTMRAARSVSTDALLSLYHVRSPQLQELAAQAVAGLVQPPAEIERALTELEESLPVGDPLRGMQVFRNPQAACSACHQVAYVGGSIGPDLSRIGAIRSHRELLQAIAFPNARLEQSYRSVKILTVDGRTFNGLVEREEFGTVELVTGADQRVRLAIAEIEERQASDVSIMPSGITETLSHQQIADLISFLQSRQ